MNAEGWPGIAKAAELMRAGADPLELVEASIKLTEIEAAVQTVGFGGAPNALGSVQLDACIMDGDTLEAASIGAIEQVLHPISVARELMRSLPHVMLVGDGAQRFARECGFQMQDVLSTEARKRYEIWRAENHADRLIDLFSPTTGKGSHGTVICLARNDCGRVCGGVSTSGWDYKYPGRLGDSPIIGAGLYVDSRFGGAACTHTGENAIRTCLARSVVLYMKKGAGVRDAVAQGLDDLRALKGGYQGQVVIYAMDKNGEHCVARRIESFPECDYLMYRCGMDSFEQRESVFL